MKTPISPAARNFRIRRTGPVRCLSHMADILHCGQILYTERTADADIYPVRDRPGDALLLFSRSNSIG